MSSSRVVLPPPAPERPKAKSLISSEALIERQIQRTRRQVKWVEIFQGLLTLIVVVLFFLFLTALLDHWGVPGGLPNWARWGLWMVLAGWSLSYFWMKVLPLIVYRIHPLYAAQTIESAQPSLRNSLINLLLLRKDPRGVPEPILQAVEESAAQQLVHVAPESVVDRAPVIRLGYVLVALMGLVALYLILSPKNPLISFGRVLWPWADIPAPTRVRIEAVEPGDIVVPRGEPVPITAQVRGLAEGEEVLLYYSTADGQIVQQAIPMKPIEPGQPKYRVPVDSFIARQDTQYFVQAGDARSSMFTIQVDVPLVVTADRLVYEYPPYTGLGRAVVQGQGDIRAVEGTKVTIEASANQPLAQAEIDLDGQGRWRVPMRVEDRSAQGSLTLRMHPEDPFRGEYTSYLLRAQTPEGQTNRRPTRYMIEVLPDRPPWVELRLGVLEETPEEIQVPRSRAVEMRVEAEDPDFGLRRVAIQLQKQGQMLDVPPLLDWPTVSPSPSAGRGGKKSSAPAGSGVSGKIKPDGYQGRFQGSWQFQAASLGLQPGDVVFYWARVEDSKQPTPNRAETPRRRIVVVPDPPTPPSAPQENPQQVGPGQQPPEPGQQPPAAPQESPPSQKQEKPSEPTPAGKEPTSSPSGKQPDQPSPEKPSPQPSDQQASGSPPEQKQTPSGKTPAGGASSESEPSSSSGGEGAESAKRPPSSPPESSENQPKPSQPGETSDSAKPPTASDSSPPPGESAQPGETQGKPQTGQQSSGEKSGQGSNQSSPSGQDSSSAPSPSGAGQPRAGEPGGADPSTGSQTQRPSAENAQTPPQRVDPAANPGKAFEEILRDRAEQKETFAPETSTSPPSHKAQEKGTPSGQEKLPGMEKDISSGQEKAPGVEQGRASGQEKTPRMEKEGPSGQGKPPGIDESTPSGQEKTPGQGETGGKEKRPLAKPESPLEGVGPISENRQEKSSPAEAKPLAGQPKSTQPEQPGQGKTVPEKGPPEAQETNQPRSTPPGQKPPGSESPQEPQSPSTSKKQSDSRGDQSGDRSGGGQQGGGQQAPQPGTGVAGSQSPSDEGAGLSQQPGPGEQGNRAGEETPASKPTGSAGESSGPGQSAENREPGASRSDRPQGKPSGLEKPPGDGKKGAEKEPSSGEIGTKPPNQVSEGPEQPGSGSDRPGVPSGESSSGKPSAHGTGNPETGGQPGPTGGPVMPNEPLRGEDPNLEYTQKAVDMALEHLRDRLREGDLRILEKLRWTREDAEGFLRHWEELKQQARESAPGSAAHKQFQEMLKNLGLRPQGVSRPGGEAKPDDLRRMREGRSVPPPPEWAEQFRAFRRSIRQEEP